MFAPKVKELEEQVERAMGAGFCAQLYARERLVDLPTLKTHFAKIAILNRELGRIENEALHQPTNPLPQVASTAAARHSTAPKAASPNAAAAGHQRPQETIDGLRELLKTDKSLSPTDRCKLANQIRELLEAGRPKGFVSVGA